MLETVRRHATLLIAISTTVLLAASQVTAQEGANKPGARPEQAVPAAVAADTVDGRHAIGPTGDPTKRAGRLVATNAAGYLPANIVLKAANADRLDSLDSTAFARTSALGAYATLAALGSADGAANEPDDLVHWDQLRGVPSAFADGTDGVGIAQLTLTTVTGKVVLASPVGSMGTADAICPAGKVVGGGYLQPQSNVMMYESFPLGSNAWRVSGKVVESVGYMVEIQALAVCLTTEPAASLASRSRG